VRYANVLDTVFGLDGFGALGVATEPAGAIVMSQLQHLCNGTSASRSPASTPPA